MATALKRLSKPTVTTMWQAADVYGGKRKMAEAFKATAEEVDFWFRAGYVTKGYHLGFLLGLEARGEMPVCTCERGSC